MIIPRQKFFSDRDSEWWKKKIAEERKRNPNSPHLKKWEAQLQYALEEEGKADPRKAEEAARRRAQGHSSYSGKTAEQKAAEDLNKVYKEFRSKVGKQARQAFNKNWGKSATNEFKAKMGVAAGVAAAGAGVSAYRARKNRKEWEKKQKTYSQKKDDKYYRGEETDYQKKMRKGGSRFIAGTGLVTGAGIGSLLSSAEVSDAKTRVAMENSEERLRKRAAEANVLHPEFSRLVNEDIANTSKAAANYERRIGKLAKKKLVSGGLKGAAIGGTIGGLAAYGHHNSVKTMHEKVNANRRHRPKKKD